MLRLMAVKDRVLDALVVAVVAGLLTLGALGHINAMAGPSDCVSDLGGPMTTVCYDDSGPSLGTSFLAALLVAALVAVLRWRTKRHEG